MATAWSRILYATGKEGDDPKTFKPGDTVNPSDLGCDGEDDPQWKEFLNSGAVREYPFPQLPENYQDSPISYIKGQLRAMEDAAMQLSGEGGVNASLMQQSLTGPVKPASLQEEDEEDTSNSTVSL